MTLVRWHRPLPGRRGPFFDDLDLFEWPELSTDTNMNIYETDDDVVVEAAVPGVPEDKVEVSVEGNVLTIDAEHEETAEEEGKKRTVYKSSRQTSFHYSTSLPRMVDSESAKAEVENGVVKVTVPKSKSERKKKVSVKKKV